MQFTRDEMVLRVLVKMLLYLGHHLTPENLVLKIMQLVLKRVQLHWARVPPRISLEEMDAYNIIKQLKNVFQEQARIERLETFKVILNRFVGPHVLKMIWYFDKLARLDFI